MKFTKGYWLNLPGVENYDCVQIREVKVSRDQVYLYAVPYAEDERAVGGPALEIFLSSPRRDILRTQAYHFMGSGKKEDASKEALNTQEAYLKSLEEMGKDIDAD